MLMYALASLAGAIEALLYLLISPFLPIIQRLLLSLLSLGPIPQHIGLIMDGNRRFAMTFPSGPLPVSQGHLSGFNALKSVLEACLHLRGLNTVTVYAFAIDNFARDESEVASLMQLAKSNLTQLARHGEVLARHSVRLRMVGRRELLPVDVRIAVEKAERLTQRNTGATLNVCIPYSSKDEMAYSINRCSDNRSGSISVSDIESNMMLAHSPPLDILVRTSGVCRLSDFMLWQSTNSQLQFTQRYWPLFGLRELVPIILDYQRMKIRDWLEERTR
ncbi:hypothetical protein CBS101457_003956 [Exobasidium rhododendri]|nr:hypothetical protein CBS101457_003956 [Exobasidium rhododendri]